MGMSYKEVEGINIGRMYLDGMVQIGQQVVRSGGVARVLMTGVDLEMIGITTRHGEVNQSIIRMRNFAGLEGKGRTVLRREAVILRALGEGRSTGGLMFLKV